MAQIQHCHGCGTGRAAPIQPLAKEFPIAASVALKKKKEKEKKRKERKEKKFK